MSYLECFYTANIPNNMYIEEITNIYFTKRVKKRG
nr:MAG TPA: hypothetical protein [Caudoviricetes sp.]